VYFTPRFGDYWEGQLLGDIRNLVGPYARAFGRSGTQAGVA
jgi:hypothetical protein